MTSSRNYNRTHPPADALAHPDGGPGWLPPDHQVITGMDETPAYAKLRRAPRPRLWHAGRLTGGLFRALAWLAFPPLGWYLSRQARNRRRHNELVRTINAIPDGPRYRRPA
jgi:hypothetical protein